MAGFGVEPSAEVQYGSFLTGVGDCGIVFLGVVRLGWWLPFVGELALLAVDSARSVLGGSFGRQFGSAVGAFRVGFCFDDPADGWVRRPCSGSGIASRFGVAAVGRWCFPFDPETSNFERLLGVLRVLPCPAGRGGYVRSPDGEV